MLEKNIVMVNQLDSKVMGFTQKFNNHMEEWFDWWNRFVVAKIFAMLFSIFLSSYFILSELSNKDRSWANCAFGMILVGGICSWALWKYLNHRQNVSSKEDVSGAIRLYEMDEFGASNRKSLPIFVVAWIFLDIILVDLRPETRNPEYLWAMKVSGAMFYLSYFFAYVSLCLAGVNNGKRKQRLKKLVKKLVDKVSTVISPPVPSLSAQLTPFDDD